MLTKLFFDALFAIADALILVGVTALINVVLGTTSNIPYIEIFGWCWWAAIIWFLIVMFMDIVDSI